MHEWLRAFVSDHGGIFVRKGSLRNIAKERMALKEKNLGEVQDDGNFSSCERKAF